MKTLTMMQKVFDGESPSKAAVLKRSKAKVIVIFDAKGVVQHEFVPDGQTITVAFYAEALKILKGWFNRVRPGISANRKLHHDKAGDMSCTKQDLLCSQ